MFTVQLHPDLNHSDPKSHTKFVRLNEAYSVLSGVKSRREYDLRFMHSSVCHQAQSHHVDSLFTQHSASPDDDDDNQSHHRLSTLLCSLHYVPKRRSHFYFLNNSVKNEPILIIFGTLNPEGT